MDLIHLIIWAVVICGLIAIGTWAIRAMGITIPQPIMIVIICVVAVVCLLFLASLLGGSPSIGGPLFHSRR